MARLELFPICPDKVLDFPMEKVFDVCAVKYIIPMRPFQSVNSGWVYVRQWEGQSSSKPHVH